MKIAIRLVPTCVLAGLLLLLPGAAFAGDPPPGDPPGRDYKDPGSGGGGGGSGCYSCAKYSRYGVRAAVCCTGDWCEQLRENGWSIEPLNSNDCDTRSSGYLVWCIPLGSVC